MNRAYGVICGMSGMGKSYLMNQYIVPNLAEQKPVIVLDIMAEYDGDFIYDGFEDFVDNIREKNMLDPGVHVVLWKSESDAVNTIHFVRRMEKGVSLVIEESHVLFTDLSLKKKVKNPLKEITMFGRHYGIDTILCTQRPANLTADVRSQAQFHVFFKLNDRADLEYARQKDPKAAEAIESLKKTEFFTCGDPPKGFSEFKSNEVNSL